MKKLLPSALLSCSLLLSCQKDPPPYTQVYPPVYLPPVYPACDTMEGRAEAIISSTWWEGGADCRPYFSNGQKLWLFEFDACNENGFLREQLIIGGMPDAEIEGSHIVSGNSVLPGDGKVLVAFGTLLGDGDVLEDFYRADENAFSNFFVIDKWDTAAHRAEGRFRVTFKILGLKSNPKHPDAFTMKWGKFWLKIPA